MDPDPLRLAADPDLAHRFQNESFHALAQTAENNRSVTAARFEWSDPLLLETAFTEEERMVRDTARDYAQSALMPRILEANRTEHFDTAIMREIGERGLLGATIDGYGCAGAGYVS